MKTASDSLMLQTRALLQTRTLKIGPYTLPSRTLVAPMAGVTDRPFRQLCKRLGAGYAVSEMRRLIRGSGTASRPRGASTMTGRSNPRQYRLPARIRP